ncbi:MAG: co-chaperone GroES, partial [Myxococcales bacterium]|nr:co-chaperone GroES [Myxococcales bacterium]
MNVRPLNDRVLVKRLEEETKTAGGLYIPDSAKEKPTRGKVVAVGSGRANDEGVRKPLDVKAGDQVLFGKYAGTEIKVDGEELIIMREEDILA